MSKTRLNIILVFLVVASAVLLWRQGPNEEPREPTTPLRQTAPGRAKADSPRGDSDTKASALITAVDGVLAAEAARTSEAVLSFLDAAGYRRFLERASSTGFTVLGRVDALRTARVRYERGAALRADVAQNADDYAAVGPNYLVGIPRAPSKEDRLAIQQEPFGNETLSFLGVTGDRSGWGRGTLIAILDSGVAHDATFGPGRVKALDVGYGLLPGRGSEDGHGTAVGALAAGAAADAPGVAPAAELLSIRVTDASGVSDLFTLARAIVTAVDAGARILNISLGGYGVNHALDQAIAYASERGAVIVAAAGNDQAAQLTWPAADRRVVSVGAVDRAEQQVLFSNSSPQLSLTAPGYGVQTAWLDGQRVYVDGTSASAPIVAGAIAAVMSQNPNLSATEAARVLTGHASDAGAPGADPAFGAGILNLGWAMHSGAPGYVDAAVASHYFDADTNQMQFVVQNRSSQMVTGMNLTVQAGDATVVYAIPTLAAGESHIVKMSVNDTALKPAEALRSRTQLSLPSGLTDQHPENNYRASVMGPTKGK